MLRTKFYWSWAGGPVLIVRTVTVVPIYKFIIKIKLFLNNLHNRRERERNAKCIIEKVDLVITDSNFE
jgi:hypothetical protein